MTASYSAMPLPYSDILGTQKEPEPSRTVLDYLIACDKNQQTPNLKEAKDIFSLNQDLGGVNTDGMNALHCSAQIGSLEIFEWLLEKGMNIDTLGQEGSASSGWSVLDYATYGNNVELIEKLILDYGFDPDRRIPFDGRNALNHARSLDVAQLLVKYNASIDTMEIKQIPRYGSSRYIGIEVRDYLKQLENLKQSLKHKNLKEFIKYCIKKKKEPTSVELDAIFKQPTDLLEEIDKQTILHIALEKNYEALSYWLIKKGFKKTGDDPSPLVEAVNFGRRKFMRFLIARKHNINEQSVRDKRTALIHAIYTRDVESAIYLIDKKADVNISTSKGFSPLHTLFVYPNNMKKEMSDKMLEIVDKLLEAKSNMSLKNCNGQTALDLLKKNYPELHEKLSVAMKEQSALKDTLGPDTLVKGVDDSGSASSTSSGNKSEDHKVEHSASFDKLASPSSASSVDMDHRDWSPAEQIVSPSSISGSDQSKDKNPALVETLASPVMSSEGSDNEFSTIHIFASLQVSSDAKMQYGSEPIIPTAPPMDTHALLIESYFEEIIHEPSKNIEDLELYQFLSNEAITKQNLEEFCEIYTSLETMLLDTAFKISSETFKGIVEKVKANLKIIQECSATLKEIAEKFHVKFTLLENYYKKFRIGEYQLAIPTAVLPPEEYLAMLKGRR